jgi:hypothetical protein
MRYQNADGKLSKLTRNEELAWAAAPGTAAERAAAYKRARFPEGGFSIELSQRQWRE